MDNNTRVLERPFFRGDLENKGAELRGTTRIGLKALFPTQGPHAAYPPTATDPTGLFLFLLGQLIHFKFIPYNIKSFALMALG
jgi:hypothetical protein